MLLSLQDFGLVLILIENVMWGGVVLWRFLLFGLNCGFLDLGFFGLVLFVGN